MSSLGRGVVDVMLEVEIGVGSGFVTFAVQLSAILTGSWGRLDMQRRRRRRKRRKMDSKGLGVEGEVRKRMMTEKSVVVVQAQERGLLSTSPS